MVVFGRCQQAGVTDGLQAGPGVPYLSLDWCLFCLVFFAPAGSSDPIVLATRGSIRDCCVASKDVLFHAGGLHTLSSVRDDKKAGVSTVDAVNSFLLKENECLDPTLDQKFETVFF